MTTFMYITDSSGKKFWRTTVSSEFSQGERNNLSHRLSLIKSGHKSFNFVDAKTARIVEEEQP